MAASRIRGVTAYIGNYSTWTHTFSTVLSTEFHVSDVDFLSPRTTTGCAGTGADTRAPADCPPLLPESLLDRSEERRVGKECSKRGVANHLEAIDILQPV